MISGHLLTQSAEIGSDKDNSYIQEGLTGGKALELGQKQELCIKQALCGSHCHSRSQEHLQDKESVPVWRALF